MIQLGPLAQDGKALLLRVGGAEAARRLTVERQHRLFIIIERLLGRQGRLGPLGGREQAGQRPAPIFRLAVVMGLALDVGRLLGHDGRCRQTVQLAAARATNRVVDHLAHLVVGERIAVALLGPEVALDQLFGGGEHRLGPPATGAPEERFGEGIPQHRAHFQHRPRGRPMRCTRWPMTRRTLAGIGRSAA